MNKIKEHSHFMEMAVEEARAGMEKHDGGPFGAVIVKDGKVLAKAHNMVLCSNDPTAHAEVSAIREACTKLGTPHLEGAVIYSNFEPCPMCLAAIYWARISELYFSGDRGEAEEIGFIDQHIYNEFELPPEKRALAASRIKSSGMEQLKKEWMESEDRKVY